MYEVLIKDVETLEGVIPGWSLASSHTNESDAIAQMSGYIESNGILPENIKVVNN